MKLYTVAYVVVASFLLATAAPALAKNVKYKSKQIGAEKTCRNDDKVTPVAKCMQKFGDKFCKEKGHRSRVMVSWESVADGYSNPTVIYCN